VRFGLGGAAYEIDLSTKTAARSHRSPAMPARPGEHSAAGPGRLGHGGPKRIPAQIASFTA
jgi:hypothetical protein